MFTVALYVGYMVVPPSFSYIMMRTEVEDEASNAYMYSNEALTNRLLEKAALWSIPMDRRNITIKRWSNEIDVEVNYKVTLDFAGLYQKDINYSISTTKPLKESSHILE